MNKPFTHEVLEAVQGMPLITTEALMPKFPHKTKREIAKSLANLTKCGFLKIEREKSRLEDGTYSETVWVMVKARTEKHAVPRVSCVWNLGAESVQIPWMPGRKYQPLGAWV